jgi:hypothetical protein
MADLHRPGLVARMDRSVIRGQPIPDCAEFTIGPAHLTRWLHPGYGPGTATTFALLRGTFEFLQIIDICLTLSVPWYADKLASKRSGWNAQGLR